MTIPHENLGYVHPVHDSRLVYATYAEMMADTGVSADLIGKLSLIEEDGSSFRLIQVTPCIKWSLFSGKDVSRVDQDFYVDGDTGNDDTGNGEIGFPFATISKARTALPKYIIHKVNCRIAPGIYDSFPGLSQVIYGAGQLIFEGLGGPIELAGPFTVTSVSPITAGSTTLGWDITVSGAGWITSLYRGKLIQYTNGPVLGGRTIPIDRNTTDTIRHNSTNTYGSDVPEIGSTFVIVEPSVKINIAETPLVFNINSNGSWERGVCIFANLEFTSSLSDNYSYMFTGTGKFLTGCTVFRNNVRYYPTISIVGGSINDDQTGILDITQMVQPSLIGRDSGFGWVSVWADFVIENTYGGSLKNPVLLFGNGVNNSFIGTVRVDRVTTSGYIEFRSKGGGQASNSILGHLECDHQSTAEVTYCIIHELTHSSAVRVDDGSRMEISLSIIDAAITGFSIEDACVVMLDKLEIVAANVSGYGVRIGRGSRVVVVPTSSIEGTTPGVYFTQAAAAQAVPSAPGRITDGFGSDLIT